MESIKATRAELESQLADRDELVRALTCQLEQAAEKLDRMQRSGGMFSPSSGHPAESQQLQLQISRDVSFLAEQWETTQLPGTLGRLEIQLQEIRDLLARTEKPATENSSFAASVQSHLLRQETEAEDAGVNSPESLELIRSLRAALGKDQQQIHIPDFELNSETDELCETTLINHNFPDEADSRWPSAIDLPDLPAAIDENCTDLQHWRAAVTARDDVISTLLEKYRKLYQQKRYELPTNAADWSRLPDAVTPVLQQLQQQLESQLRLNEVSMSLERARLSREATRLETVKIQLQKDLKRQGINSKILADLGLETTAEPAVPDKNGHGRTQRWLSMLKIKDE